jgi:hypothetical protein
MVQHFNGSGTLCSGTGACEDMGKSMVHAMLKHRQAFDGSRFGLLREAAT